MTFQASAWSVDGNPRNGMFERGMLQQAVESQQGILGPLDLIVQATTPNSQGVQILPGQCVITGLETSFQGTYYAQNQGNDTSLSSFTPTGGTTRSDMVVAQAQDPTWTGSPWGNAASGPIVVPAIISNVSSSATTPPGGISAIPLARIDWPANTSIITQGMITDLRQVANLQRFRQMQSLQGIWSTASASPTSATVVDWPANALWTINIPSWATFMMASWTLFNLLQNTGFGAVTCSFYPVIGSSPSSPIVAWPSSLANSNAANQSRLAVGGNGQIAIPASIRGTTQTLQFAASGSNTGGTAAMDASSALIIDYEFLGLPSLT